MRNSIWHFFAGILALPRDAFIKLFDTFAHVSGPPGIAVLNRLLHLVLAANVALNLVTLLNLSELIENDYRGTWLALLLFLNYFSLSKALALRQVLRRHQADRRPSDR
jgi:hypothetical protein